MKSPKVKGKEDGNGQKVFCPRIMEVLLYWWVGAYAGAQNLLLSQTKGKEQKG